MKLSYLVIVGFSFLLLTGCGENYSWNQKFTVEVETPQGLKTASSVVRLDYRYASRLERTMANAHSFKLTGEAVVLEVTKGRYLFALVTRNGMEYSVFKTMGPKFSLGHARYRQLAPKISDHKNTAYKLDNLPMLVTFDDLNDPASVKRINANDLAASFGAGVMLKRITLEITSDPMTNGRLRNVFTWLGKHPENPLMSDVSPNDFSFAAKLRQGDFLRIDK